MALNLWKLAGNPTSYNPLPTLWRNFAKLGIGEYIISFKAKSQTNADLSIIDTGSANISQAIILEKEFREYSISLSVKNETNLYLKDREDNGLDIQIKDISIIEKPTGKATINGIDGFLSGKWTINNDATVIDDETLELNTQTNTRTSLISIEVSPSTEYTYSIEEASHTTIVLYDKDGVQLKRAVNYTDKKTFSFTTTPDTVRISLWLSNYTNLGKCIFKRPMLTLGNAVVPYQRKTGDRMVVPVVASKNLIANSNFKTSTDGWVGLNADKALAENFSYYGENSLSITWKKDGHQTGRVSYKVDNIDKNKKYVFSFFSPHDNSDKFLTMTFEQLDKDNRRVTVSHDIEYKVIEVRGVYRYYVEIPQMRDETVSVSLGVECNNSPSVDVTHYFDAFQLEEGVFPTEYEPYGLSFNEKPRVKVPKKNLFDGELAHGGITVSNGAIVESDTLSYSKNKIPVIAGKTYTMSLSRYAIFYDVNDNPVGSTVHSQKTFEVPQGTDYMRFSVTTRDLETQIQLEEGSVATPYEPYELVIPRPEKGLVFDGIRDYIDLPDFQPLSYKENFTISARIRDRIDHDGIIFSSSNSSIDRNVVKVIGDVVQGGYYNGDKWISVSHPKPRGRSYDFTYENRNGEISLIVDGQLATGTVNAYTSVEGTGIGRLPSLPNNRWFDGVIEYLKVVRNDEVALDFDFTNTSNIVGDKFIPNAKNLIPSFEDGRWSFYSGVRILGRDILEYYDMPTTAGNRISISVKPNTNYYLNVAEKNMRIRFTLNGKSIQAYSVRNSFLFNSEEGGELVLHFDTYSTGGNYHLIRPQLFEAPPTTATFVGNPNMKIKAPKRNLFAKR